MKNAPEVAAYRTLLADIGRLFENARQVVAEAYWKIGQRLVEVEQDGAVRARYGEGLLKQLSEDLSAKYGRGFSVQSLQRMRSFYLACPKYSTSSKLAWSQYVELLPLRDEGVRGQLARRAKEEDLSPRQLRKLVHLEAETAAPRALPAVRMVAQ